MKCVYQWFGRFQEGWESVSDKTRSGRPTISTSDENMEKDSWSASWSQTPGSSLLRIPKRPAPVFFELFLSFLSLSVFPDLLKYQGQSIFSLHVLSLVGPNESIPDPQLIRAHCSIIRQLSSPPVSSQTFRCPTHDPNTKLFRPTVAILLPLMSIRHCICKAKVTCLGSDLVYSSIARLLFVQSHWHQSPDTK
ncbi:uncharacterized protein TNCV_1631751 [Trichonephila clavipes]|nr:uncharacterized protein TNCV_1631751 [Trichonephila clavipes]